MARVKIDDETWAAYRVALGSTPLSVALGRLVEREVAAMRRRSGSEDAALRDTKHMARELDQLVYRVELRERAGEQPGQPRFN